MPNMIEQLNAEAYDLEKQRDALLAALEDAVLHIEYLHEKFRETGSGNCILARSRAAIAMVVT